MNFGKFSGVRLLVAFLAAVIYQGSGFGTSILRDDDEKFSIKKSLILRIPSMGPEMRQTRSVVPG